MFFKRQKLKKKELPRIKTIDYLYLPKIDIIGKNFTNNIINEINKTSNIPYDKIDALIDELLYLHDD
jgi:hypothetical protein